METRPVIEYYTKKGVYIINRDLNGFLRFQTRQLVEYGEYDSWALIPEEDAEVLLSIVDSVTLDSDNKRTIVKTDLILRELLK